MTCAFLKSTATPHTKIKDFFLFFAFNNMSARLLIWGLRHLEQYCPYTRGLLHTNLNYGKNHYHHFFHFLNEFFSKCAPTIIWFWPETNSLHIGKPKNTSGSLGGWPRPWRYKYLPVVVAMSKISHMDLKLYTCYHYQICGEPLLLPANLTPYWLVGPVW